MRKPVFSVLNRSDTNWAEDAIAISDLGIKGVVLHVSMSRKQRC